MLFPGQVVLPDELEMLARVCRTACKEEDIPLNSRQAQTLASHVLKLFLNGLTGEEELLSAERNRMKRQAHVDALKQPPALQAA
ncbi:hypothetical protein [Mesorhizobium sp. CO1-1-8]|uniref:hypothetical protein n=1 Tax=Mesorhizobium sp. CO1-1-8 TaxID=2876631 RepID=UPI001CD13564|nr:hypothetical protein [Mesorhizobium sp. CO1-1-8]MBZ9775768.1 hypothetical protein [Mesorhizobium sp. CO1-1-8]